MIVHGEGDRSETDGAGESVYRGPTEVDRSEVWTTRSSRVSRRVVRLYGDPP